MTIENYLQELLSFQELTPEQERTLQAHKNEITNFLREEFGGDPSIKYAGSHAKGTMIQENYDLDIVCYFPSSDTRTLKEIRDDVSVHLSKKYILEEKASAERILNLKGVTAPHSYHIDVVPGRFIEGTTDVFINIASGDKQRLQTNLKTHIDHIANSGCTEIIRLTKLWAYRNGIHIKTFILELFVIRALSGSRNKSVLKESFLKVIEEFKDEFGQVELEDPANSNNVVSRTISQSDKAMVTHIAKESFEKINNSDDLDNWKDVFKDTDSTHSTSTISTSKVVGFVPHSPWCN